MQMDSASKLNALLAKDEGAVRAHVERAEAALSRRISTTADRIVQSRPRLLLLSGQQCGGVAWLAHALELQLKLRESRVVCLDAQEAWGADPAKPGAAGAAGLNVGALHVGGHFWPGGSAPCTEHGGRAP